jgi:hypothetical protein
MCNRMLCFRKSFVHPRINFNPLGENFKQNYSMKSVEKGVKI